MPARLAGRIVDVLPVNGKVVALTFDAGANAAALPSIRATLERLDVRATFFLTGNFVKRYPVRSARVAARDVVGNHSLAHPDLTSMPDAAVLREVRSAESLIKTTTGQDPRRFFRFPYGATTPHLVALLNSACYVPFGWTIDTLGWKGTSGGQSKASVITRVLSGARPGAIVLMHVGSNPDDGTTLDAAALPDIVKRLRAQGYRFVRLARIMDPAP